MPEDQPYDVYRHQLSSLYHGYALWEPEPVKRLYDKVSIGDVGYVYNGFFYRMFNVTRQWDHPSNQKLRASKPAHYAPMKEYVFDDVHASRFSKGDHHSPGVSKEGNVNNIWASGPDDAEGFRYRCQGPGALLSLPRDGHREEVIRTKAFEDYIRDNVVSWFEWAKNQKLPVDAIEDLILVNGCTLVGSWAAVTFDGRSGPAEISLVAQTPDRSERSFEFPNIQGNVTQHCSYFNSHDASPDQCVFIKGFRAKRRLFWTVPIRAQAEPLPDEPDNNSEDDIQVNRVPDAPKCRDLLIGVLDYILEKCPNGTIAIAHDDDLQLVKDVKILTADAVENFLHENQFPVLVEKGAAILCDHAPSPGPPPTLPPLPSVVPSSPTISPSSLSPYPSTPHPHDYIPSPIPQAYALPFIPPAPLTPGVFLHPALAGPSLKYDVRYPPSQNNPPLSPTILATPASNPPLPSLGLRVGNLPWIFNVFPDARLSPGKAHVTVNDVLLAIHYHLLMAVKSAEYEAMSKSRKAEILREFELRAGTDPIQRGKGLRRVDFLNGRVCVHGLVRAVSEDSVWDVVVSDPFTLIISVG